MVQARNTDRPARSRTALIAVLVAALAGTVTLGGADSAAAASGTSSLTNAPIRPFDAVPSAATTPTGKLVFAHYLPSLPVSIDNDDPDDDYYARSYLRPDGEGGKHAAYGGFLRDRPLPRPRRSDPDWRLRDLEDEVRQAASAGIDGFSLDLLSIPDGRLVSRTAELLLDAAAVVPDFKIMLMPDMTAGVGKLKAADLANYLADLADRPSAFRLGDGRLVVAPYAAERRPAVYWEAVIRLLGRDHGIRTAFVPVFLDERPRIKDFSPLSFGMGNWGVRNPLGNDPSLSFATSPMARVADVRARRLVWMQPVSVQDERPVSGMFQEAENTENLRRSWELAMRSGAEWVQLVTWNDYSESTQIAPSLRNGWSYLDLMAYYIQWFKTGAEPPISRDAVYLTHRIQRAATRPVYPQSKLMRRTFGSRERDMVEALTLLTAPARVTLTVGGVSTSCLVPAGVNTCLAPLREGTVSVTVARSAGSSLSLTSAEPVTDRPYVQDLQYVATSAVATDRPLDAGPPTIVTVPATEDTYVTEGAPNDAFGGSSTMATLTAPGAETIAYLKFDVPAAPAGKRLTAARLELHVSNQPFAGSSDTIQVRPVTNAWDESTVTWTGRPTPDPDVLATFTALSTPDVDLDVALDPAAATAWPGTTRGLALTSDGSNGFWLWTGNYAHRDTHPRLILTYR